MAKIAISYRRTDSDVTGRIFDRFVQRYGKDSVFRDIDNIPFGIDFRKVVNDALRGTDVLIAIVGPNWRGTRKRGSARINDENDLVRIEVETALQRDIPVIPALVGGAMMPKPSDLPDSLRDFSFRNAANIDSGRNFDTDIERLMRSMDRLLEGKTGPAETTFSGDTERITVPTVRSQEPLEEATPAPAVTASMDQSIESEGESEAALPAEPLPTPDVATSLSPAARFKQRQEPEPPHEPESINPAPAMREAPGQSIQSEAVSESAKTSEPVAIVSSNLSPAAAARQAQAAERGRQQREEARQRAKAPSRRMALIGVLLGLVAIGAVGIWAVFRPPTSIQPPAGDVHTPVRESVGEVPLPRERERALKPKDIFKECATCPEMVVVPAGSFTMGSPESELLRESNESPQHAVTFARQFAVGRFALTFDEWDACAADGGCNGYKPSDQGWGRRQRPVINVSWDNAKEYAAWLSRKTGKTYRLLSEAEREYVTRAGTTTPFWWGSSISTSQANYNGSYTYGGGAGGQNRQETLPVDSFQPNPWGLYQVHGNVWDWVEDCYHDSYGGAPSDGSAWTSGDCSQRVVRGGSWGNFPPYLRSADRYRYTTDFRLNNLGFRVGRTLTP
jgi:formylglycine-generating enzyme required for sulfatase activity